MEDHLNKIINEVVKNRWLKNNFLLIKYITFAQISNYFHNC